MGPSDLAQVLRRLAPITASSDPSLLVGSGDDAAVYAMNDKTALVFTADFFTPIVDDPFDWGRIAAANALSDVYAMGGRPVLCLNIAGWPRDVLPIDLFSRVLEGGASLAMSAGAIVAGGHTVDDAEPKYGMAVVGFADPTRLLRMDAARPGDVLVLTKPLGLGVIATAIKRGLASKQTIDRAVEVMTTLNEGASKEALAAGVKAATDVTGFGLLGHLHRLLDASAVSASLQASTVPVLGEAEGFVRDDVVPSGTRRNMEYVEPSVSWNPDVPEETRILLADAQTSGGMLLCCPADSLDRLVSGLAGRGILAAVIGVVEEGPSGTVRVGL